LVFRTNFNFSHIKKTKIMKKIFTLALYGFAFLTLTTSCWKDAITPSGRLETQTFSFTNFSEIHIGDAITIDLIHSENDEFITIEADDNIFPFLKAEQVGKRLKLSFNHRSLDIRRTPHIVVTINYSNLTNLTLSGASCAEIFNLQEPLDNLKISIEGASKLRGTVHAKNVNLILGGASQFNGKLYANHSKIMLGGASSINLSGESKSIELIAGGASIIRCYDLICEDLDITLSGASNAQHTVTQTLKVRLSGASILRYVGDPQILPSSIITGGSTLQRR